MTTAGTSTFISPAKREPSLKRMVWAAPDGPATTLRYEALCEGIQFAEALVVVSEALDTKADALGPARAAEFRHMLTELWRREVRAGTGAPLRPNHEGWQAMARWLLDAAALSARLPAAAPPKQSPPGQPIPGTQSVPAPKRTGPAAR